MSSHIPPKFYQICRLCMSPVGDCEVNRLRIFSHTAKGNQLPSSSSASSSPSSSASSIIKLLASATPTAATSPSNSGDDNHVVHEQNVSSSPNHHLEFFERCGESEADFDIISQIFTCLSIKVSRQINHTLIIFTLSWVSSLLL